MTQAAVNSRAETFDKASAENARPGFVALEADAILVDGVMVGRAVGSETTDNGVRLYTEFRLFGLVSGDAAYAGSFSCAASEPIAPEGIASIKQLLDALHFSGTGVH
jgi:hypothetical protein